MTVAAAVIAYNAADVIGDMLDSLTDHVDEIVVCIDPKTTDHTENFLYFDYFEGAANVHVHEGIDAQSDGFAAARNHAFGKAWQIEGVEWVMWIDTDDTFGGDVKLKDFLAAQPPDVSHIFLPYLYHRNEHGDVTTHFDRERVFRKSSMPMWKFALHEVCDVRRPLRGARTDELWVDHTNVAKQADQTRGERNFKMLRAMLEQDPTDARAMMYLGHQHFAATQWTNAAEWYEKYLNAPSADAPVEKWQILIWLARARRNEGDVPASIKASNLALTSHPEYPDAYHELAHSYAMRRQWRKAIEWHEMGLSKTERPPAILINSPQDYGSNPYLIAHTCYYHLGRYSEAIDCVTKALEWQPDDNFLKSRGNYYLGAWNRAQAIDSGLLLAKHLLQTNEPLKARRLLEHLPAGASEDRPEVIDAKLTVERELAHLSSEEEYENFYLAEQPEKILPDEQQLENVPRWYPRMDWVAKRIPSGSKVLEVGVGNAIEAFHIVRSGSEVVGIDIDPKRIKDANLHSVRLGFRPDRAAPEHTTIPPPHVHVDGCHYVELDGRDEDDERDGLVRLEEIKCGYVEHRHTEWTEGCEVCGPAMRIPDMAAKAAVQFHWCPPNALSPKVAEMGPFDYVVASEVIEHVEDPGAFLDFLEGVNGAMPPPRVILTTPDGAWRGAQARNPSHVQVWSRLEFEILISPRGVIWNSQIIDHPWGDQPNLGMEYLPGEGSRKRFLDRPPVAIFCGPGLEKWSPLQVDGDGLGGSETAVVHVAKGLCQRGMRVTVFAEAEGIFEGVRYRTHRKWAPEIPCWLLISWRHPEVFDHPTAANHNWLWAHDTDYGDRVTPERMAKVDTYAVVSEWHREHTLTRYPFLEGKVIVVGNGIDPTRFEDPDETRILDRVVYTSSPDRGLEQALTYWPRIMEIMPSATLTIFYGWDNYDLMGGRQDYKRRIRLLASQPGVVWRGRIGQQELARELAKASVLLYPGPHPFAETFGITFVEAQAAGCIPVTRDNGALPEVNRFGAVVPNDAPPERWVTAMIDAMNTSKHDRERAMAWARTVTWDKVADRFILRGMELERAAQAREGAPA